jgi:hypothetical protein
MPLINVPGSQDGLTVTLTGLEPETIGAIPASQKAQPQGVATLGNDGLVLPTQLPNYSVPTLSELGGIPASEKGAINGVATLGSNGIVPPTQLPVIQYPTLVDLGGVPLAQKGVANGVATLGTDGKIPWAQSPMPRQTQSVSAPSTASDGDLWLEQDPTNTVVNEVWRYRSGNWRSQKTLYQTHLYFRGDNASENWEIRIWPTLFSASRIYLMYLEGRIRPYVNALDASNYWKFTIYGSSPSAENYWNQITFNNIALGSIGYQKLPIDANQLLSTELIRLRVQADAVGNPGVALADFAVAYYFIK